MLDKTLGYILCCQSPALFLAALALLVSYFAARKRHRAKAAAWLILTILFTVGGVVLYFLGMLWEYFTIRDFYRIRPAGWVGLVIVAALVVLALVRAFLSASRARREEKEAARAENLRQNEAARAEDLQRSEAASVESCPGSPEPVPAEGPDAAVPCEEDGTPQP